MITLWTARRFRPILALIDFQQTGAARSVYRPQRSAGCPEKVGWTAGRWNPAEPHPTCFKKTGRQSAEKKRTDPGTSKTAVASIGDAVGVATPVMDALIALGAVIMGKDCWKEGRNLDKLEIQDWELFNFPDFWFPYAQHRSFIKKTERSDTIILGILAHFRHFSGLSGLGRTWENFWNESD